jgi:hypothetical protein
MGDRYREEVGRLREALNDESRRDEAAELVRGLVESIVLNPAADGGGKKTLTIDLKGHLAGILALGSATKKKKGANGAPDLEKQIKLVAGACNSQCSHRIPAPFRLAA